MLKRNEKGIIKIADDVIAVIAMQVAVDTDGIAQMSSNIVSKLGQKMGGKTNKQGVTVMLIDQEVHIALKVIIEYGVQIRHTCQQVQQRVKEAVQVMTGLDVSNIDICVEAIHVNPSRQAQKQGYSSKVERDGLEYVQFIG